MEYVTRVLQRLSHYYDKFVKKFYEIEIVSWLVDVAWFLSDLLKHFRWEERKILKNMVFCLFYTFVFLKTCVHTQNKH